MERIGHRAAHDAARRAIRVLAFPCSAALALALLVPAPAGAAPQDLPPALAARFSEGVADLAAGRLDQAEAAFRAVLSSGGDRAFVHHNLGIVLQRRGRHADALVEFRAASRLDPSFGPSHLLEGASLLALGQPKAAVRVLGRASELMPREPAVHLQLADACERIDDVICLTDEYRTLVDLAPGNPEYAYRLGKAYLRLSQWTLTRMQIDRSARLRVSVRRKDASISSRVGRTSPKPRFSMPSPGMPRSMTCTWRWPGSISPDGRLDDASRAVARALALVPDSKVAQGLQSSIEAARARRHPQSRRP